MQPRVGTVNITILEFSVSHRSNFREKELAGPLDPSILVGISFSFHFFALCFSLQINKMAIEKIP